MNNGHDDTIDKNGDHGEKIETLSDIKLARTALVTERWPMAAKKRKKLIKNLFDIALKPHQCKSCGSLHAKLVIAGTSCSVCGCAKGTSKTNQRKVIMAGRTLIAADRLNILENQQAEAGGFLEGIAGQAGTVNVQVIVNELRADPEWEEFARAKMLEEAAKLPAPSTNGNSNGNGTPAK